MNPTLGEHVKNLKAALLSLSATGEKGFEGLVREALREITGVPFRLAGSGSQYGIDGKAAYEADAISFEGKLYSTRVPKDKVLSRIAEVPLKAPEIDMWVLGATCSISEQNATILRRRGTMDGIHVQILEWSSTGLPRLAVALAMGGERVLHFLKVHINDVTKFREAKVALGAIRCSRDFVSDSDRIRAECNVPSVGLALAQRANTEWLCAAFSNRRAAKIQFGQPLAPGETNAASIRQRKTLIDQLNPYLTTSHDEMVLFVLGGEGHGKSWIVAQSWLSLVRKPLMLFLAPNDFADSRPQFDVTDLLVRKLARQTGERDNSSTTQKRWRRRFEQWRKCPSIDGPRLIVVIDGINQRPGLDWARIIMRGADEVGKLGGCVVVTARTPYFRARVEPRLSEPPVTIDVPEWTETERDAVLSASGMKASDLYPRVAETLRNPRLLGIALELMTKDEISSLEELSVSRLLFEHMRMSERDAPEPQPVHEIAHKLQGHAQEIISRVKDGQEDDLAVFDDIQAVADGRFFQTVDGDPTRYSLKDEGLTLALGFFVIDRLLAAQRNGRDLREELNVILEPTESLSDTASVVLAALTISAVDHRFGPDETVSALIEGFASLQNPNQASFPAFVGLTKRRTQCFMDAAQALCLSGRYQPNLDWIQDALIAAGRDGHAWQSIAGTVHSWLSAYSLSPDRGILRLPLPDQQQRVQDQREKSRMKIEEKLQSLSPSEQGILETMPEEEGDLSRLSRLALSLLAGKPLAPFAESLMKWCLASALNSDHATPYKDFRHLVSLNRIDWSQTREALLLASTTLQEAGVSTTAKWAFVTVLRATGHPDDAKQAQSVVEGLTKGRPRVEGWRRVEQYCESDPCDPASEKPENVAQTAEQYAEIDVRKLSTAMGPTSEDHFWSMARPGIARFRPDIAIAKHKEFIADVLGRKGFPLRQGLFELRRHAALLSLENTHELVKRRNAFTTNHDTAGLSKEDAWIVSQYHLLLAFPFLSATEQAAILLASENDERFLLDLFRIAKPLSEKDFESLLETACVEDDERGQYLLLQLAFYTSAPLSTGARKRVATLIRSESDRVRTFALGVIAQSGDEGLLGEVVESDWIATDAETKNYWETWFGSMALLEAASQGLIAHEEAVDRISARMYGRAAAMLNADAARAIACRIDTSIDHVARLNSDLVTPDIELELDPSSPWEPSMFTVNERPSEAKDLAQQMRLLSEDQEAFEQRQKRSHDAFRQFEDNLTKAKARIILDDLGLEGFAAVVAAAGTLADRWYELFMNIAHNKLPSIHNLAVWLAHALARKDPEKAEMLLRRVKDCKPFVQVTYGRAGVQLDAMASWASARSPALEALCFARLDRATTDHELALEVFAALLNGQQESLAAYIEAKLSKQEPAEVARGIAVAGFSDESEFNAEVLARYEGSAGLLGDAQRAAKYAYERNAWARHWFERMCETNENADFWCYSVLFLKIVDGRFGAWRSDYARNGNPIQLFGFSLDDILKKRFERWKNHRSKKLFGLDAPASIFLEGADIDD